MKTQNVLIFLTYDYPYGKDEAFIEKEMPYLENAFDKIVIISNNLTEELTRPLAKHVSAVRSSFELDKKNRIISITGLFSIIFWNEIFTILFRYRLRPTAVILNTLLSSLRKGKVFGKRLKKIISTHTKPTDNIYLYSFWTDDNAFAIAKLRRSPNIKKVFSRAHRWDIYFEENESKYLPYRKYILKNIDVIYSSTESGQKYYQKIFPELQHKIQLSYLGVGRQTITATKPNDNILRIVSCSYLMPRKRIHLIVEALELVNDIKIEWIHFGGYILINEIKQLCHQKLDPKLNIKYDIYGGISNTELIQYYTLYYTDLFINVSSSEGLAVSIMEALSFGIPCLATDVGGTAEIVNNENGFLLSPDPVAEDIAKKIIDFYNLNEEKKQLKRNSSYKMWAEKCNAEKNYTDFISKITTQP